MAAKITDKTAYDHLFAKAEAEYNLPAGLLKAVSWVESRYNEKAVAPQYNSAGVQNGGRGLMQFVRTTAEQFGIDPFKPSEAVDGAGRYMSNALKAAKGDIPTAIQMYNMGVEGGRKFMQGDTSVRGDPAYYTKVMDAVQRITNNAIVTKDASTFIPPKATTVADAVQAHYKQAGVAAAAPDTAMLAPTQENWTHTVGEMTMTSKLNSLFDKLNAEHESAARSGRDQLEQLLGD